MAKESKDYNFSLVEYLMIIMIIGILVVFIVPFNETKAVQPKIREMKDNVRSIIKAYDQSNVIETLKLTDVEKLNSDNLKYSLEVNNFLKYVNFEKVFCKKYLAFNKKKDYYNFLRTEVRPLVNVADLTAFDNYINNLGLIKIANDYDLLPNLGSFLQEDKFLEFYALAEEKLPSMIFSGVEEGFNNDVMNVITFVKSLKPVDNYYNLTYKQIKRFSNINLVDVLIEDEFFVYDLKADSTIVSTTTENFGDAGAQVIYNVTDETYQIGPKKQYQDIGLNTINATIASLPEKTSLRDEEIRKFKTTVNPDEYDLNISTITKKEKESLINFEGYIKRSFNVNELDNYLHFYENLDANVNNLISNNTINIEGSVMKHDKMANPNTKIKNEIKLEISDAKKLNVLKAAIQTKISDMKKIVQIQKSIVKAENYQELKDNYIKSFNVIDQDWLLLE